MDEEPARDQRLAEAGASPAVRFLERCRLLGAFDTIVAFARLDGHPFELSAERGRFLRAWARRIDSPGLRRDGPARDRFVALLRVHIALIAASYELHRLGSFRLGAVTLRRQARQAFRAATVLERGDLRLALGQLRVAPGHALFASLAAEGRWRKGAFATWLAKADAHARENAALVSGPDATCRYQMLDPASVAAALAFLSDRLDPRSNAENAKVDDDAVGLQG